MHVLSFSDDVPPVERTHEHGTDDAIGGHHHLSHYPQRPLVESRLHPFHVYDISYFVLWSFSLLLLCVVEVSKLTKILGLPESPNGVNPSLHPLEVLDDVGGLVPCLIADYRKLNSSSTTVKVNRSYHLVLVDKKRSAVDESLYLLHTSLQLLISKQLLASSNHGRLLQASALPDQARRI